MQGQESSDVIEEGGSSYPRPDPGVIRPAASAEGFAAVGSGRRLRADVVVVGSGPGGAALSRVLAEGGLKVVVLEEGPATSRFRPNQNHTQHYHMQEGGSILARGRATFPVAAGRGVGGGTLVNSALSFRAPAAVLDSWAELLDDSGWSAKALEAVYDEVSAISGVGLTPDAIAGENNRLIVRGVEAMGWDGGLAPRSTPGCVGCGVCNYGCPSMGKASTNHTFLPRAVAAGALIQAECQVREVIVEGGRAVGVRGVAIHPDSFDEGGTVEVRADRVVLSAGAIGTPRLLWASGLAKSLGPRVGEGLHVHPGNAVLGICDHEVHMWKGASQGAYFHHPELPGVLPHTFTAPPEACLMTTGLVGPRLQEGLDVLPRLCGLIVMVSDKGQGRVRAWPSGRADVRYEFSDEDLERTKRGMVESARVLLAGGAKELLAPVHGVGRHRTAESLAKALAPRGVKDFTLYAAHPMSTCRMGREPELSVTNSRGETHGLPGLYIADAGSFPTSLGVNPQITTMVVGTVIGKRMLQGQA